MITIGSRSRGARSGFLDLLSDCHARIRAFAALAERLASGDSADADDVRAAAHRVRRYFGEALPLHARDEDESVVPRLLGRSPEVDRALRIMSDEHDEHRQPLAELVRLCSLIEADPGRRGELCGPLGEVTGLLVPAFADHLANEEANIFPALAALLADEPELEQTMLGELRARRAAALG